MKSSKLTIFVDLDGVLTDFIKQLSKLLGKSKKSLSSFGNDPKIWKKIDEAGEDFWADMPWMPNGKDLWSEVKKHKPTILSAPTRHISSKKGKKKWIRENIPGTPVILDENKAKHANKGDILIDDRRKNIDRWNKAGGVGILHKTNTETLKKLKEAMKMKKKAALKPGKFEGPYDKMRLQETSKKAPKIETPKVKYDRKRDKKDYEKYSHTHNYLTASLDELANRAESMGYFKEAYDIDVLSNTVEAAVDTSTLNGIRMLWDKFKGNLKEFYGRVTELVQRNRLSYRGDNGWLTAQIKKITGKPFFMSPRDFAVQASDNSEED